jgi:hypothetical protein
MKTTMTDADTSITIPMEYITCDAEGWDKASPPNRCARCRTVYYCDAACVKRHWKAHKPDCRDIRTMQQAMAGIGKEALLEDKAKQDMILAQNPECGICLEDKITEPVVLEGCHHGFCFSSVWQAISDTTRSYHPYREWWATIRLRYPKRAPTVV